MRLFIFGVGAIALAQECADVGGQPVECDPDCLPNGGAGCNAGGQGRVSSAFFRMILLRHKQIFDDPDRGIYDIAEYKIIDPETEAETSLPDGLSLRENKLTGRISTPGTYTITIRAIDGAGLYTDHTFTITVIPNVIIEPEIEQEEGPTFEVDPVKPIKVKPAKMQEVINEVNIKRLCKFSS